MKAYRIVHKDATDCPGVTFEVSAGKARMVAVRGFCEAWPSIPRRDAICRMWVRRTPDLDHLAPLNKPGRFVVEEFLTTLSGQED